MVVVIREVLQKTLNETWWMDPGTKTKSLEKVGSRHSKQKNQSTRELLAFGNPTNLMQMFGWCVHIVQAGVHIDDPCGAWVSVAWKFRLF